MQRSGIDENRQQVCSQSKDSTLDLNRGVRLACLVGLLSLCGVSAGSFAPVKVGIHSAILSRVKNTINLRQSSLLQSQPAFAILDDESASLDQSTSLLNRLRTKKIESTDTTDDKRGCSDPALEGRGGATVRPLLFWETMVCGAISRSTAQTILHPANTMKTILQNARGPNQPTIAQLARPENFRRLSVGAGANFILSVPHGAVNFAVLELVRRNLQLFVERTPWLNRNAKRLGPGLDFFSSCISTVACSVVSTPQMMITDNIMAGNYPNLPGAVKGLAAENGIKAFYRGWWPGLVGKIPSYALTWTFFQQLKRVRATLSDRPATDLENSALGCIASTATVCIMIPMDTIKTRLVTQSVGSQTAYKGVIDCAVRVFREEGMVTFYRGLPPRLISVVPMIGIQFGIYESMKKFMLRRDTQARKSEDNFGSRRVFAEAAMEVAASPEHPYPAPHFLKRFGHQRPKSR